MKDRSSGVPGVGQRVKKKHKGRGREQLVAGSMVLKLSLHQNCLQG